MTVTAAYIVSRFPKISETFILYEILALRDLGFEVEIFPLVRQQEDVQHPEVQTLLANTHYHSVLSGQVLAAQIFWLFKRPTRYFGALWKTLTGNARSPKFLVRGLAAFLLAGLFARKIQAAKVQHVHAHWATHPALAAYVIHHLTGLPYSFTAHAHDIYVDQTMLNEKMAKAAFVVTISEYNRRFLTGLYGAAIGQKIDVIRCGIDPQVFRPTGLKRESDVFTMITVASLEEKKGHAYLIEACRLLKERGVDFRCLLVGDGELRDALQTQIDQHGLTDHIVLLGRQPRHKVSELLNTSDVLVLPSIITSRGKKEGIPVALMEALAAQLAVIATDISGISELVVPDQTGVLVPEKDAVALADALERLRADAPLRARLGEQGRAKVLEEFDLHRNTAALADRFTQAAASVSG